MHNPHHHKRVNIETPFLPLFGSLIEKVLNGEQKFSSEEAKGCEKISEREAEGTNPAVTGSVPSKEAEKGTLGATFPAGIGPLAPVVCWKKKIKKNAQNNQERPQERNLPQYFF